MWTDEESLFEFVRDGNRREIPRPPKIGRARNDNALVLGLFYVREFSARGSKQFRKVLWVGPSGPTIDILGEGPLGPEGQGLKPI